MARKTILLVDPDERNRRFLDVSLRKAGYSVTTAIDGLDALDKLTHATPDVIIAETVLAGVDGFELRRRTKADLRLAGVPFVFLTAEKSLEHKIRGLELGVDEYLIKPIFLKEIVTRVKILIERREREQASSSAASSNLSGKLEDMGVVDLIQSFELGRKSGVLRVTSPASRHSGEIYLAGGRVVDALLGSLGGEHAVYRMLVWGQGRFEIQFGAVDRPDRIGVSVQGLLMEGMRRIDEWGRLLEQLPALDTVFDWDFALLAERLAEIPDDLNAFLQLIDGRRSIGEILDSSTLGDLETLDLISKLYFEGLLHSVEPVAVPRRPVAPPPPRAATPRREEPAADLGATLRVLLETQYEFEQQVLMPPLYDQRTKR